jgi:hypothetical protein
MRNIEDNIFFNIILKEKKKKSIKFILFYFTASSLSSEESVSPKIFVIEYREPLFSNYIIPILTSLKHHAEYPRI